MRRLPELAGKVLVIEDDTLLRQMIGAHLRSMGCTTDEVATVEGAREALTREDDYDVVISDIHLSDGDVLEAIHEQHLRYPNLPVVFITGDVDRNVARQALAEDPAAYLLKPFEFSELTAVVAHALKAPKPKIALPLPAPVARGSESANPIPILLRPPATDHERKTPRRLAAKVMATVALMLALAFGLGHALMEEEELPPAAEVGDPDQKMIVVPITVPAAEAPPVR